MTSSDIKSRDTLKSLLDTLSPEITRVVKGEATPKQAEEVREWFDCIHKQFESSRKDDRDEIMMRAVVLTCITAITTLFAGLITIGVNLYV